MSDDFMHEMENAEREPVEPTPRWFYEGNAPKVIVGKVLRVATIDTSIKKPMDIVDLEIEAPCGTEMAGVKAMAKVGDTVSLAIKGASLKNQWGRVSPQVGQTVGIKYTGTEYSDQWKTDYPTFVVRVKDEPAPVGPAGTPEPDPFSNEALTPEDDLPF